MHLPSADGIVSTRMTQQSLIANPMFEGQNSPLKVAEEKPFLPSQKAQSLLSIGSVHTGLTGPSLREIVPQEEASSMQFNNAPVLDFHLHWSRPAHATNITLEQMQLVDPQSANWFKKEPPCVQGVCFPITQRCNFLLQSLASEPAFQHDVF